MRHDAGPDTRETRVRGTNRGRSLDGRRGAIGGLIVIPGNQVGDPAAALGLAAAGLAWGALCAWLIPWGRWQSRLLFHVPALLCLPYLALAMAATGGAIVARRGWRS